MRSELEYWKYIYFLKVKILKITQSLYITKKKNTLGTSLSPLVFTFQNKSYYKTKYYFANNTAQKIKFSIRDFLSKCDHADLVTFSEEILNGKLHFFVQCKMIGGSMNKENPEPYLEPC